MKGPTMTWAVEYLDGTHLTQYNDSGDEIPYRSINWPQVKTIVFANQDVETRLDIQQPPPGHQLSLRSRHTTGPEMADMMTFIILVSREGEPIADSTTEAIYCMPDGTVHQCYLFDCPEVRQRCSNLRKGEITPIHAVHSREIVQADAHITA